MGINYGLLGDNLPTPTDAVALMKRCGMTKVRLFEPKPEVLQALRGSGLNVSLGIRNEDLSTIASSTDAARTWLTTNYYPFIPDVNVLYITAGNEVIPAPTPIVSGAVLQDTYPPSAATFTSEVLPIMTDLITFLKGVGGPLFVNVYPYFAYAANPTDISLDFALLQPNATGFMDGSLMYTNLFDAMYDAAVWAAEKAGGEGLNVYVSETGWPSGGNGAGTTPETAAAYRCGMNKVRLFEPKPQVLQALRGSGLGVSLGIRNEDLSTIASSTDAARTWLTTTNYYPFIPDVNILYITAGNEVIPGSKAQYVVPALKNIQAVLTQDKKTGVLPTTVISDAVFQDTYPPSGATFTSEALPIMTDLIAFLKGVGGPLFVNIYPYLAYAANPSAISLDYALRQPNATGFMDGSLMYTNLFDAMYDAAVWAAEKAGGEGLNVYVSETGWRSGGNGAGTTPETAAA
ncbi:hypothetical protein QJS10_CPB12g01766 [Acorus calamus]|uniref:Glucan endo-1,3-beta-D-glucosidase n=1 Tax=Acorus calamus TaxID=4465 RepID=A0AAV9DKU0_ACOCL|nr:hypothetical protein QJS10_CPB12g01766 [Acorus calamus]